MLVETSLLLGIPVLLILNALDNYYQKQEFKKIEKEMREKGLSEKTILLAKHFYTH
jgi:hypothetical protein